jgi:diguanylate cyclase (GGDEF)-like protein/PAS domain S-box-containing protein
MRSSKPPVDRREPTSPDRRAWKDEQRLAVVIGWIANTVATIVALVLPLGFAILSYQSEAKESALAARLHAVSIMQAISNTRGDWRRDIDSLIETRLTPGDLPEQRLMTDFLGNVLAVSGPALSKPVLTQTSKVYNRSGPLGEVVVHRSLRPMLLETVAVALMSLALGAAIYFSLRVLPMRALRRALNALKREEARAREESEEHLRIVFQNAIDGIFMFTPQGGVRSCNPAAAGMFHCSPHELTGRNIAELLSAREANTTVAGPGRREALAKRRDGSTFPVDLAVSETRIAGEPQCIAIVRDITERQEQQNRLARLASFDSLTGLHNRSVFREHLQLAMQRCTRQGHSLTLMFLDLDRFKTINDSLGHDVGDQLLIQVARVLEGCLRSEAERAQWSKHPGLTRNVYRLGGDEFTMLVEDLPGTEAAARLAQRVLDAFARPYLIKEEELFVSTSIGVTLFPQDTNDLDGLIKQADMAMYRSKALGRDTYFFYNQSLVAEATERHALEANLRHALERGEFHLHYQPKADIRTGDIIGFEALLRWRRPGNTSPGPDQFIPILEETGLIVEVGEWVLREACMQMVQWRRQGMGDLTLAVNLSARQFRQLDIVERVASVLMDTGFEARHLELELTESMLVDDGDNAVRIMNTLGAMGVRLAIDDFGTGHSSLSYLKRFNVDVLKIDRSFVRDIPHDAEDCAIAQAVIALAHSLHLQVVAEGVDSPDQVEFLRQNGCNAIQGYLVSKPLDPQWLLPWLRKRVRHLETRPAELMAE